jgi:antirestriction protein ArdC
LRPSSQVSTGPKIAQQVKATELGGCVRKGEHGSLVVYADSIKRTEQGEAGEDVEREIPFMKGYTVFNVEQIGGLPESYYDRPPAPKAAAERHAQAEEFIAGTGASIAHGGNGAFYAPAADRVQLPPVEAFKDQESYYGQPCTNSRTGQATPPATLVHLESDSQTKRMRSRNW